MSWENLFGEIRISEALKTGTLLVLCGFVFFFHPRSIMAILHDDFCSDRTDCSAAEENYNQRHCCGGNSEVFN